MSRRDDFDHEADGEDSSFPSSDNKEWVTDDALAGLALERHLHPEEDEEATSRRLLRENVAIATQSLIHLAVHGSSDRLRLDASKYIIERVLGRVGDDAFGATTSPVESFVKDIEKMLDKAALE